MASRNRTARQPRRRSAAGMAAGRNARLLYVAMGMAGLTALAIAIVGPRRVRSRVLRPAGHVFADQAERAWAETRPLRIQLAKLLESVQSESGRERLVRNLQSWIGHFRAED